MAVDSLSDMDTRYDGGDTAQSYREPPSNLEAEQGCWGPSW